MPISEQATRVNVISCRRTIRNLSRMVRRRGRAVPARTRRRTMRDRFLIVMGPDGDAGRSGLHPFPLLLDVGGGVADEPAEVSEDFSSPIGQLVNPLGDAC